MEDPSISLARKINSATQQNHRVKAKAAKEKKLKKRKAGGGRAGGGQGDVRAVTNVVEVGAAWAGGLVNRVDAAMGGTLQGCVLLHRQAAW